MAKKWEDKCMLLCRFYGKKVGAKRKRTLLLKNPFVFVGLPGLEPGKAGPESAVLPLHHSPIDFGCKGTAFLFSCKRFCVFFAKNFSFFLKKRQIAFLITTKEDDFKKTSYLCTLIA